MSVTKLAYEQLLNEVGCPNPSKSFNRIHVPRIAKNYYGTWLRKYHPSIFDADYRNWKEHQTKKSL